MKTGTALIVIAASLAPLASQARWLNPNTGRFETMDTYEGNKSDPQSLHKYTYAADNPVSLIDPIGERYYFGGDPGATVLDMGHFWVAVDTPGGVLRYDYGMRGYNGPTGSFGQSSAASRALRGRARAAATPFGSISEAAGGNGYYGFDESAPEDAAMAQRMIASTNNPPAYSLITHNCGHASFEIAQHGWPRLAPDQATPNAFLEVVRRQWRLRNAIRSGMNSSVNNVPEMTISFSLP